MYLTGAQDRPVFTIIIRSLSLQSSFHIAMLIWPTWMIAVHLEKRLTRIPVA